MDAPDSERVFFGSAREQGRQFFRHAYAEEAPEGALSTDLGSQGFVVVTGYREALALRSHLDSTGDWINAEGKETRPSYAITKLVATSAVRPIASATPRKQSLSGGTERR
jgi:hypothetical protein